MKDILKRLKIVGKTALMAVAGKGEEDPIKVGDRVIVKSRIEEPLSDMLGIVYSTSDTAADFELVGFNTTASRVFEALKKI